MSSLEKNRNELIELENRIAILEGIIVDHRDTIEDGPERRKELAKMQMELGKHVRRMRKLKGLV